MRSVNKVILIGNLTRDPEMRQTPNGQNVTTFGLATNREWMTKDNKKHSLTEFHDLVSWAKLADICQKYLKKGKLVYVEGYLKTRSWDTPEGIKKFKTEIVVQDMIMLDSKTSNEDYIPEEENVNGSHMNMGDEKVHSRPQSVEKPAFTRKPPTRPAFKQQRSQERKEPIEKNTESSTVHPSLAHNIDIDKDLGL